MIQRPELLLYIAFAILAASGFLFPPLFLVLYANHKGTDQYWAAFLLSVLSLADLLGRLACGWLANLRVLRNHQVSAMVSILLGVVVLFLPITHAYWPVMAFTTLYGFLFGCFVAVHIISIVEIVELADFYSATANLWGIRRATCCRSVCPNLYLLRYKLLFQYIYSK